MRRWIGPLAMALVCAIGAHLATLQLAPGVIMSRAMEALAARGVAQHGFTAPQRVTPQTQSVVRSSPDLFYALCRYDFSHPASQVSLRVADWPGYQSLSFFDAGTDNFATLRGAGKPITARLLPPGSAPQAGAIVSPTAKGVILIRRLAPDSADFAAAAAASSADRCQLQRRSAVSPAGST